MKEVETFPMDMDNWLRGVLPVEPFFEEMDADTSIGKLSDSCDRTEKTFKNEDHSSISQNSTSSKSRNVKRTNLKSRKQDDRRGKLQDQPLLEKRASSRKIPDPLKRKSVGTISQGVIASVPKTQTKKEKRVSSFDHIISDSEIQQT